MARKSKVSKKGKSNTKGSSNHISILAITLKSTPKSIDKFPEAERGRRVPLFWESSKSPETEDEY